VVGHGLRTVAEGLDHPEDVCWSPTERAVYAGGEAGQVYRFRLGGGAVQTVATIESGFLLGLARDGTGSVYTCDPGNGCVHRVSPDGRVGGAPDLLLAAEPRVPACARGGVETMVDDWTGEYVLTPTNTAFAGEALDVLVRASLGGWAVKAIDPDVHGAPLHYSEPGA
jgi:sugar lactone lactonase YvrE